MDLRSYSQKKYTDTTFDCLIFGGTIVFWGLRIFFSSGQLTPDGIQYLLQAQEFWKYVINFPLGYSFLIKILSFFTGSFFIASKLINILSYLGIIFVSYKKKFFFPQTLLIFSFYPFTELYSFTLSESLYYFFNYLIIYYTYKIIRNGFNIKATIFLAILFFFLISVRLSGIFVFITTLFFLAHITFKKKYSVKSFLFLVTATSIGVLSYLLINYLYCGFAFGKRSHLHIEPIPIAEFISNISLSTFRDFSFLNAIIHKGISNRISFLNLFVGIIPIVASAFILIKKRKTIGSFSGYLIFSFSGIMLAILYSYYTINIDDTIRIKSNAYLYLMLFLACNVPKNSISYSKAFIIAILGINCFTLIKYSENIKNDIPKYKALICRPNTNTKTINIIYKNINDRNERYHSSILFFKALLIDEGYQISESNFPDQKASYCHIRTSEIIDIK